MRARYELRRELNVAIHIDHEQQTLLVDGLAMILAGPTGLQQLTQQKLTKDIHVRQDKCKVLALVYWVRELVQKVVQTGQAGTGGVAKHTFAITFVADCYLGPLDHVGVS